MLTHGDLCDFALSILKCEELKKIYRVHPHRPKILSHRIAVSFYITQHTRVLFQLSGGLPEYLLKMFKLQVQSIVVDTSFSILEFIHLIDHPVDQLSSEQN